MGKLVDLGDRYLGRLSNAYGLWPLVPAGTVGIVTGWLSSSMAAVNQFGAFGWWSVGLIGFLLTAGALALLAYTRERWAMARAAAKWSQLTDSINPLSSQFDNQRIKIPELAHPLTGRIPNKRFANCQLLGDSNIVMAGDSTLIRCQFISCDFVIVRDNIIIQNTLVFENCTFIDTEINRCTIFLKQSGYDQSIRAVGNINLITFERPGALQ